MANITINDPTVTQLTAGQMAEDDIIPVWDTSAAAMKKANRKVAVGANITGEGVINTNGRTLNLPNGVDGTAALLEVANTFGATQVMPSARSGNALVLNDDTAVILTPPTSGIIALIANLSAAASGLVMFRCSTTQICAVLAAAAGTVLVATTNTILTGTTGTDGKLTVSAHSNGNLYIENRTGSGFSLLYFVMG